MMPQVFTPNDELAKTRIVVYRFIRAALSMPSQEQHTWLLGEEFRSGLELLCEEFAIVCPFADWFPEAYGDFESRYLACFEVGFPEPPVVLAASHYNHREPAQRLIHEHILFYKRFGFDQPETNCESADHLINELSFLIHLDNLLLSGVRDLDSLWRGRRDFLVRQAGDWPATAAQKAKERQIPAVYCALLNLLTSSLSQDIELTLQRLAQSNDTESGDPS